jgi:hypothetical protein
VILPEILAMLTTLQRLVTEFTFRAFFSTISRILRLFMYLFFSHSRGTVNSAIVAVDTGRGKMAKTLLLRSTVFATSQNTQSDTNYFTNNSVYKTKDTKLWEKDIKQGVDYSMQNVRTHMSRQLKAPL